MGKITFILGGARSGKSRLAVKLAEQKGGKVAFIATCMPKDLEMKRRIYVHKNSRPGHWKTFEDPKDITLLLNSIGSKFNLIIIDCLTLLVSGFMLNGLKKNAIETKINRMLAALRKINAQSIIVSNEVGLGIVPENKLARDFRDIAGRINQSVAAKSDAVFLVFAGIPLKLK